MKVERTGMQRVTEALRLSGFCPEVKDDSRVVVPCTWDDVAPAERVLRGLGYHHVGPVSVPGSQMPPESFVAEFHSYCENDGSLTSTLTLTFGPLSVVDSPLVGVGHIYQSWDGEICRVTRIGTEEGFLPGAYVWCRTEDNQERVCPLEDFLGGHFLSVHLKSQKVVFHQMGWSLECQV